MEDEVFKEVAESEALRLLKDKIHTAIYDAWREFDYSEAKNVTPVVQEAVTSALSRAYRDITGDELFPEKSEKEVIFGESLRPF